MTRFSQCSSSALACLLLSTSTGLAQEASVDPVLDCRSLPSAEERLKCYDNAVDERAAPVEAPADAPAETVAVEDAPADDEAPEAPTEAAPDAPAASSTSEAEAAAAAAAATAEQDFGLPPSEDSHPDADQIKANITELSRMSSGKYAIELDNGQLWRQTTTSTIQLKEGDAVIIKRAALGSYKLTRDGSKRSIKVKRVK